MTTEPGSEPSPRPARSKGLLWAVVLLVLVAAGLLWGASALVWVGQRYRTPFGTEVASGITGEDIRPELVPMALAALAAVAAVLATGGWLRRVVGALIAVAGAVLGWRVFQQFSFGWFATGSAGGVPPGSTPIGEASSEPYGPLLMTAAALLLFVCGVLVALRAGRMPAMGAKYSAPGAEKQKSHDPDRQMWNDLDAGRDPTDEQDR
ncbi:Trp biosynthesis-associated membrane protein [Saccharopolyspora sp. NPDC050389]|uniref:Trp biosynthesis-associated membrane protein n=1 Tax=Saccharopolyspora sp. NPDC050389 TaxID=3155516 RepID=UPI0033E875D9